MKPGSEHDGTQRPPEGKGRISAPRLRQSARPRLTRRDTLTSITGHLLWSGPRGVGAPPGRFLCTPLPGGTRHGGEKAPARRESKGSERRKVFAKQNPESGRKPLKAGGRAFGASLARRTADATLPPLRALPGSGKLRLKTGRLPPILHRLCIRTTVFMVWGENPERWSVLQWLSGLEGPRSEERRVGKEC